MFERCAGEDFFDQDYGDGSGYEKNRFPFQSDIENSPSRTAHCNLALGLDNRPRSTRLQ